MPAAPALHSPHLRGAEAGGEEVAQALGVDQSVDLDQRQPSDLEVGIAEVVEPALESDALDVALEAEPLDPVTR